MRPLLAATLAAFGLGLAATALAVSGEPGFDPVRLGPWTSWPQLGAPEIDPYERANVAMDGFAPIGLNEGLSFIARADDLGAPLDARCDYTISGTDLPARLWTLAAYSEGGRPQANPANRHGLTSAGLLRTDSGDFVIAAARQARPGNWLPLGSTRSFVLALRLYQASTSALSSAYDGLSLPKITRGACP
ncbi:hypothetical protein CCR94_13185 [Rhodoblastus sphagnicola]|uniref:DUF1214 domain-containing protein n=1 Tax=Rhodoblastus sphagnicola TaxID=333368 RepID=A0A2S6N6N2_9HYPH|nr:DUF1214 domain-containing protein [Rhodoblastus sphagnicola]MBB4197622.1 hypothetical protein [Rhodoblastus sphagnicola]PPQ30270.1 hypothetical protein CCR94_13185 [Rhodoblastus sphagnicola]